MAERRQIPRVWGRTNARGEVEITQEARQWFDDLVNGEGADSFINIGQTLSGVKQQTEGLIAGTQPVQKVLIDGFGDVQQSLTTQAEDIVEAGNSASSAAGGLTVDVSSSSAFGSDGGTGDITSSAITLTPTNGIAPYTYAWAFVSGDAITADSPAAATTSFTGNPPEVGNTLDAIFSWTVTDSTGGTPLTRTGQVSVSLLRS